MCPFFLGTSDQSLMPLSRVLFDSFTTIMVDRAERTPVLCVFICRHPLQPHSFDSCGVTVGSGVVLAFRVNRILKFFVTPLAPKTTIVKTIFASEQRFMCIDAILKMAVNDAPGVAVRRFSSDSRCSTTAEPLRRRDAMVVGHRWRWWRWRRHGV